MFKLAILVCFYGICFAGLGIMAAASGEYEWTAEKRKRAGKKGIPTHRASRRI